jgi:hypothetical protein
MGFGNDESNATGTIATICKAIDKQIIDIPFKVIVQSDDFNRIPPIPFQVWKRSDVKVTRPIIWCFFYTTYGDQVKQFVVNNRSKN